MKEFKGIYAAAVTPYDKNGNINYDVTGRLVEKFLNEKLDGIYLTGSTGEFPLLDEDERIQFTDAVCKAANGKTNIIVQVASTNLRQAIRLARAAEKSGADAISSVVPFYFGYEFSEIKEFFSALSSSVDIPMIMYNVPGYTNVSLTVENLEALAKEKNIVGMKHTSYDLFTLERVKTLMPEFTVFSGPDEMCLSAMAVGADGAIGTTYNFQGQLYKKMYAAFHSGDMATALECQKKANAVIDVMIQTAVIQSTKYFLAKQGYDCGECREPMKKLSSEEKYLLDKVYDQYLA